MNFSRRHFVAGVAAAAAGAAIPRALKALAGNPMKYSFRLAVINDEIDPDFEHACHVAAVDLGLSWIELRDLWGKNIANLDEQEIAKALVILKKYKLRVTDIASPLFKTDWPDAELLRGGPSRDQFGAAFTFKQQGELLERCIHLAKSFGTERIRCFDFFRLEDQKPYRAAINEELRKAAVKCGQNNLILMLENEQACNTVTGKEIVAVFSAVQHPSFMLNWDAANAASVGDTPYPNDFDLLPKNRIAHCHCKDVSRGPDGKPQWAAVGSGVVDWPGQIKALMRQNYHLGLSLETHWRGAGTAEASTRQSMAGLKAVLEQVGA